MSANKVILVGNLGKDPGQIHHIDPASIAKRFWRKAITQEGCWGWVGSKSRGYGQLSSKRGKPPLKAHRVSWMIHYGPIPKGKVVRHKCDNPSCANPKHLALGTQKDNVSDMVERGRLNPKSLLNLRRDGMTVDQAQKRKHCNLAKLGISEVQQIKKSIAHGGEVTDLSKKHNVSRKTIQNIINNKTWSYVA